MTIPESAWVTIGLTGQLFFTMRFVVQWIATERKKKSVVPEAFWYFSIVGSLILLAYSIYRKDPVFILGQSFGMTVYLRNLYFIQKGKKHESD
ncbi:MAG: lipid-A-disaccharide synthase N-terminal domain-containing protein [Desulfuromonadaceae bacterium]|nr:lipid-A-disaccharide synthase N-terminal domain-containing protein [Desulfuromonadaceae bacterium]